MNRRGVLLGISATVALAATGGILLRRAAIPPASMEASIALLETLKLRSLASTGAWTPFQVFSHLAQSIEFSMQGYPAGKSVLFQNTVGKGAFFAFSTAGAMRHPLDEPIPGAPAIAAQGEVTAAIERVIAALHRFESHRGTLAPHFAYGALSKEQYAAAHVMHIDNHLTEITD